MTLKPAANIPPAFRIPALFGQRAHLYGLPATGLWFFTVYGPWGRQDRSPMLFARAILAGEPINVFNHGRHT